MLGRFLAGWRPSSVLVPFVVGHLTNTYGMILYVLGHTPICANDVDNELIDGIYTEYYVPFPLMLCDADQGTGWVF